MSTPINDTQAQVESTQASNVAARSEQRDVWLGFHSHTKHTTRVEGKMQMTNDALDWDGFVPDGMALFIRDEASMPVIDEALHVECIKVFSGETLKKTIQIDRALSTSAPLLFDEKMMDGYTFEKGDVMIVVCEDVKEEQRAQLSIRGHAQIPVDKDGMPLFPPSNFIRK